MMETQAGLDSGFEDEDYLEAGAKMVTKKEAWDTDLVLKVKEPLESEYKFLKNQILFTYLHLSGVPLALTETLFRPVPPPLRTKRSKTTLGGCRFWPQ